MKPSKIWANLCVQDLERTTKFYSRLGFRSNGSNNQLTSFFAGENAFIIHFFLPEVLKSNIDVEITDLKKGNEVIFTLSADTREEVDEWQKEVIAAGGTIVSPAAGFGENYYGFVFSDPDGHTFNVFQM